MRMNSRWKRWVHFRNFRTFSICLIIAVQTLTASRSQEPAPPLIKSIAPGSVSNEQVTADGRLHQFRVDLKNPNAPHSVATKVIHRTAGDTTYYQSDDTRWYKADPLGRLDPWEGLTAGWSMTKGNAGHPDWGTTNASRMLNADDFFNGWEFDAGNPSVALTTLGYELTVAGVRLKAAGGTGAGAGPGADEEESWGASVSGVSIDGFDPSTTISSGDATIISIGGGTVTIKGTVTAGHKVAADGTTTSCAYTYTVGIKGEGMGDFEMLPVTTPHPTGPIYNGSLATWNTTELVDGVKKYPPGEYLVQLKVIPTDGGAGGQDSATIVLGDLMTIVNPTPPTKVGTEDIIMTPVVDGAGNEFTYSTASPGVLTIPVKIKIVPDSAAWRTVITGKVRVRISAIDDSHGAAANVQLAWTTGTYIGEATAGSAVYNAGTHLWEATCTFTGLPPDSTSFGLKSITADILDGDGNSIANAQRGYEVFFARDATNHPALDKHPLYREVDGQPNLFNIFNIQWSNWMYYWLQTVTVLGPNPRITFLNVAKLNNEYHPNTNEIQITSRALVPFDAPYGTHNTLKGIDDYAWVLMHESQHYKDWTDLWGNSVATWEGHNGLNGPGDDKDGEKIPNQIEDANLNGTYDFGDLSDWQVANTPTVGRSPLIENDFEEWDCQRHTDVVGDHAKDWADPGMQHHTNNRWDD